MKKELDQKKEITNLTNLFLKVRDNCYDPPIDEVVLKVRLLSVYWDYLDTESQSKYFTSSLMLVKKYVENGIKDKSVQLSQFCDLGVALYFFNQSTKRLDKFILSFNKIFKMFAEAYILNCSQINNFGIINISCEDGISKVIKYMLCYKTFYFENINKLSRILVNATKAKIKNDFHVDLGMRYGIGGVLSTLTNIYDSGFRYDYIKEEIAFCIKLYNESKLDYWDLSFWPAIYNRKCDNYPNLVDDWNYGASKILLNLLRGSQCIGKKGEIYLKELQFHSYLPLGDHFLSGPGYSGGVSGLLEVIDYCYKNYHEPCFYLKKISLIQNILESKRVEGNYIFYEFSEKDGRLLKTVKTKENSILENYMVYIVLCETLCSMR